MKHKKKQPDGNKQVKAMLLGLAVLTLISFFYRLGLDITKNQLTKELESWKQRAIEAEAVKSEVEKVEKEIKETRKQIEDEEAHELAVKYTASARAFDIPVSFVLACVKLETGYNPNVKGPFDEREDFQIYRPSFARYFPASEWHDRQKRYIAGLLHYVECVKIAQRATDDTKTQLLLSLALHNSGTAWKNPYRAFDVAWRHVKRAEKMRIWEIDGMTEQDYWDRGIATI